MTSYVGDVMTANAQLSPAQINNNSSYISSPSPQPQNSITPTDNNNHPPRYGTKVPNRIFVGGIDSTTRDLDLAELFSGYGQVKSAKVIADRAGVSKGYGFVTFFTEKDAQNLMSHKENIILNQRKLNIAPAVKKQYDTTDCPYDGVPIQAASYQPMNAVLYQNSMIPYIYSSPTIPYYIPPVHLPQMQGTDITTYQAYGMPGMTSQVGPHSSTPYSMMYVPHTVFVASPQHLQQYQQLSPAWVDSGISGQYHVTSAYPFSGSMY